MIKSRGKRWKHERIQENKDAYERKFQDPTLSNKKKLQGKIFTWYYH